MGACGSSRTRPPDRDLIVSSALSSDSLIRRARPGEAGLVMTFIRELADYEKLSHEVTATEAMIDAALFCDTPRLFCVIVEWNGEPVGFAVWFINFSTFSGRSGVYLEDLFVRPEYCGK